MSDNAQQTQYAPPEDDQLLEPGQVPQMPVGHGYPAQGHPGQGHSGQRHPIEGHSEDGQHSSVPPQAAAGTYDPAPMGSPLDPPAMHPQQAYDPNAQHQVQHAPPLYAEPGVAPQSMQQPQIDPATGQYVQPQAYDPSQQPASQAYAHPGQVAGQQAAHPTVHDPMMDPHNYAAAMPDLAPHHPQPEDEQYATREEDLANIRPVPRVSLQAFCETEIVSNTIDQASRDRRMSKAHVKVNMGGIAAAVDFYQTATTPNLIIVESKLVGQALMGELGKLAEVCDDGTNVVVVGHKNDVLLYRNLIALGVAEYLVAPISMTDVMDIVTTLFVNPEAAPLGNTIVFLGAKGGVGSSTIAHNVAWAISSGFESDVILTDLDLAFGTANIDFDQDPAQGVAEAVFSSDRIDETFLDRLLAKCSDHLSLLAAPSTLDREYDFDAEDFNNLLEVAQRGTPNVIVDLPHVWTGWAKEVLTQADKVVITATPDLASLRNTKNLVDMLAELRPNDGKPYLVLNQCNVPKRPEISVDDFTQPLGIEPTIVLNFEPALYGLASNNGQMLSEADPKSDAAQSLETLAQVLTGRREIEPPAKASLGSFLSRLTAKKKKTEK